MRAITISENKEPLSLIEKENPMIKDGEFLVKIHAAALNRRDQWIREGKYPGIKMGAILGSDGSGVVVKGAEKWIGKEVIINPNVAWGNNPEVQAAEYSVLGMPTDGALATYIKVSSDKLIEKPVHLSFEEAAALPLTGLTAFRAIKKAQVMQGNKVLVTGIGGGVSQMALYFCIKMGAEVYVTSGADWKIEKAVEVGATKGVNYKSENWSKELKALGLFDAVIDSAGGNSLNEYIKVIKPSGKIVMYGSTTGYPEKLDVFRLFWKQAQIIGSTMGNDEEFEEMVSFINQHQIKPTIDEVFDFDDYLAAFDRFKSSEMYGKIVLKML